MHAMGSGDPEGETILLLLQLVIILLDLAIKMRGLS